ncbi:MAG: amidohydrolase family protein [Candidatus Hinthialibacter antarcticus]|nr:amidohydrolase family protein [Candidatus Hinthialibacter antarcticus]
MIDSHQHFWQYTPEEYAWIGDNMTPLRRDCLPDDLKPLIDAAGVQGTVAVQARQCLDETQWLLQLAGANEWIVGVVGWVDLRSDALSAQLERFSKNKKLVGVRHVVHDEPDDEFLLREDFLRGIQMLADYDLAYDLLLFEKHLPVAIQFVETFPDHRIVLDHISKPLIKDRVLSPWDANLRELAKYPNVYCKVSGMVTEADWTNWTPDDLKPYLDVVFDAFGPERIMLGSDWPVCTVAGSYQDILNIPLNSIESLSIEDQEKIKSKNARRAYKLPI